MSFPLHGILPKDATQASSFLKKYPQFDGDGVVIAILDTGVDPGAPGLQTTTRNLPKIVDVVDCCGSGDVRMGPETESTLENGVPILNLKSGKVLKLGKQWENPSKKYRHGQKRGYELFPTNLVSRMTKDRKEKFEKEHSGLIIKVQEDLNKWEKEYGSQKNVSQVQLEIKADLDARVECLNEALKNYEDAGPVFDCIVWNDGKNWRSAIDIKEDGDLTTFVPMTDFKIEHQYTNFGTDDMLNFSVNIYDNGSTLSIVTVAGAHGTHVAAIAAANYPEEPEINGIAPGARIVSLKIGESRLGSMETGTGLTRALNAIVENNCDVCNMSYGEDAGVANEGRWIELLRDELINKRRIIFVSSAGNAGPALSTVGAPGGTTSGVIGVGAFVTPEMMQAEYAMLDKVPERPYTWSSRSPAYDGAKGVTIYAPGAAITSVPQYLLTNSQLMNGTSMSSPNACGNIALLISGCKTNKIPLSPYRLEKALINTAKDINDEMRIGFMQIEKTWEYLNNFKNDFSLDLSFEISVSGRKSVSRGIYLREAFETNRVFQTNVNITPKFRRDDTSENSKKLAYEHRLVLIPTAPYVKAPEFLLLNSGGRDFQIRVDPTTLPAGLHYAEVEAFVCGQIEKGPVFKIPVTIAKGEAVLENSIKFTSVFHSGHIERRFVNVPVGASWAVMTVKAKGARNPGRLVLHLLQVLPFVRHTKSEQQWYLPLNGCDEIPEKIFHVHGGVTMEVCMAQFWSSLGLFSSMYQLTQGSYEIELELNFHGVQLKPSELALHASSGFERVDISSRLQTEKISPSISLDSLQKFLRPSSFVISPQMSRDVLINGKTNLELILTYKLTVTEPGTYTFRKPALDDCLYDSLIDSVLFMVHDSGKRMIYFGDIYPKPGKLNKGEYTIRIQLRHDNIDVLEKMKNMPLIAEIKLASSISLGLYDSPSAVLDPTKKPSSMKNLKLDIGDTKTIFVDVLIDSLPKEAKAGDLLVGKFNFGKEIDGNFTKVSYAIISEPQTNNAGKDLNSTPVVPIDLKAVDDAVRDAKLAFVDKLTKNEEKRTLLDDLCRTYSTHASVLIKNLDFLNVFDYDTPEKKVQHFSIIVKKADDVLKLLNVEDVLSFLNSKPPNVQSDEYKNKKKEMEDIKKQIITVYHRKVDALLAAFIGKNVDLDVGVLDATFEKYFSIADQAEFRFIILALVREYSKCHYGSALKLVTKYISDNANGSLTKTANVSNFLSFVDKEKKWNVENDLQIIYEWKNVLLRSLGWSCWDKLESQWSLIRFPENFATF